MKLTIEANRRILTAAHKDFVKGLFTYATFKVNNTALSEDLVQDTYIKTWLYIAKGGEILKMKAFLYHILNGLIIDEYRKRKVTSLDQILEIGFDVSFDTSERLANTIDGAGVLSLLHKLPSHYQSIVKMRYVDELSLEEISERLGTSKSTLAVQSHRGLEKLKTLYLYESNRISTTRSLLVAKT